MTSVRLGKKIAYISAVALLVAACEKKPEPAKTTEEAMPATESASSAQPDAVSTPTLTAEELEAQKMGNADQNSLAMYAGDRVFFEYDSSELTDEARSALSKQYDWLMHFPRVRVTVEGHCDERGTREYNLALGERRANAVKNYLIALGVPASRLNTISYGKERPAVVGNGEASWSQNRRGVLVVQ